MTLYWHGSVLNCLACVLLLSQPESAFLPPDTNLMTPFSSKAAVHKELRLFLKEDFFFMHPRFHGIFSFLPPCVISKVLGFEIVGTQYLGTVTRNYIMLNLFLDWASNKISQICCTSQKHYTSWILLSSCSNHVIQSFLVFFFLIFLLL